MTKELEDMQRTIIKAASLMGAGLNQFSEANLEALFSAQSVAAQRKAAEALNHVLQAGYSRRPGKTSGPENDNILGNDDKGPPRPQ